MPGVLICCGGFGFFLGGGVSGFFGFVFGLWFFCYG